MRDIGFFFNLGLFSLNLSSQSLAMLVSLAAEGWYCRIKVQESFSGLPASEFRPEWKVFSLVIHCLPSLSRSSCFADLGISNMLLCYEFNDISAKTEELNKFWWGGEGGWEGPRGREDKNHLISFQTAIT